MSDHHDPHTGRLDENVPVRGAILQIHLILQAGATPADHGNP